MERAPHPRIVERLFLAVDPGALDDALIVRRRLQAGGLRRLARRHRIGDADVIDAAGQDRRPQLGRKRQRMKELHLVEIRQPLVPVIRVLLQQPAFVLDPLDALERAGAGIDLDLAQIVVVVFQRLLADDDVPAAGDCRHDEIGRPRLGQHELHRALVGRLDFLDRPEQHAARDADPLRRLADAVEGGLDVVRGQLGAVVELHAVAQMKRVGLCVLGISQLCARSGISVWPPSRGSCRIRLSNMHPLRAEAVDRPGLVHVEMRRPHRDADAQPAAMFRVRLRGGELEFRPVEFHRHRSGAPETPAHRIGSGRERSTALENCTAAPPRTGGFSINHLAFPLWLFSAPRAACSDMPCARAR